MTALQIRASSGRKIYLTALAWGFPLCSSARLLAYLPTLHSIHQSGDSSQHSLWTWFIFFVSNLAMAAWLYEQSDQRTGRAVLVNLCNAVMCAAIVALIIAYRF